MDLWELQNNCTSAKSDPDWMLKLKSVQTCVIIMAIKFNKQKMDSSVNWWAFEVENTSLEEVHLAQGKQPRSVG